MSVSFPWHTCSGLHAVSSTQLPADSSDDDSSVFQQNSVSDSEETKSNDDIQLEEIEQETSRSRRSDQQESGSSSCPKKRRRFSIASQFARGFESMCNASEKELEVISSLIKPSEQQSTKASNRSMARRLLLEEFADLLDMDEMVAAINIMDEEHATTFLDLSGAIRQAWLFHEINKPRNPND